jgi:putative flippase GtrA
VPGTPRCRTLGLVPAPQHQRQNPSTPTQQGVNGHPVPHLIRDGHASDNPDSRGVDRSDGREVDSPDGPGFDLASALATAEPDTEPAPTGLVRRLIKRFEHLIHEVGKFGVVGAIAFAVDFSVFNLLLNPIGPLPAKTVSTVISASVAFVGNRFWTWRHRPRSGLGREYGLYFLFNGVGLGIGLACLWLSHYGLGSFWPGVFQNRLADNISSLGVGMVLGTLFRFWSYRRIVFRAHVPARDPGEM